ncbi:MAG: DNA-binding protein [Chloroflexi bacterium]|nr:DNA-binding protein [Chloroflexota bacterium]MYE40588.1 DNA-binding protein [Chloroflexota bacterium]
MAEKTVFLAWQDKGVSREWFPIGRLDADVESEKYRFRYIGGAKRAEREAKFPLLVAFPRLEGDYKSSNLFSTFSNRVMWPSRPDFKDYLNSLALTEDNDPMDMMAVSGGRRVTDSYEVFPKIVKKDDGSFVCRFFLHGGKRVSPAAQERLDFLSADEELYLALELTNPLGELAVQIQTTDYHMIGWSPRYMARDLALALAQPPGSCRARVVRVNLRPVPSEERVLVEMSGNLGSHEPMSGPDFQPLVPD